MSHPCWPLPFTRVPPLIVAHRGARRLAPENTLAAARQAYALGADAWELDVEMSADHVPVLLHDDTLERTTDAARQPELASLASLRSPPVPKTWATGRIGHGASPGGACPHP